MTNAQDHTERQGRPLRKEFEVSMLFEVSKQDSLKISFVKNDDGTYTDPRVEDVYKGYVIRSRNDWAKLRRYDPTRFIGNGMYHSFMEKLDPATRLALSQLGDLEIHNIIRAALGTAGDMPNA